ncbi:MAG: hypothetical protein RLZ44_463 [Pseudomonadota bacterium]|jgi:hypothetical protein
MARKPFGCAAGPCLLVWLLAVGATAHVSAASAADSQEIEALKQQVRDLQLRVSRLEANADHGAGLDSGSALQPFPGGWREPDNWKLLGKGMEDHKVLEILGEPDHRKTVGKHEFWSYGDGTVKIYLGRLSGIEPPSAPAAE